MKILIVEDDLYILDILTKNLIKNGYEVTSAENGKTGLATFEQQHYDLVISDLMMPYVSGISLIKQIRQLNKDIPIIILTALDSYSDKEMGFQSGTDDYMVKPVNLQELNLRIKALLRRYKIMSENVLEYKRIFLNYQDKSVTLNGELVSLTIKEFELLFKLLSTPNRIFTREQLMNEIWGYDNDSYDRTIDTHIKRIREKIKTDCFEIITVRGLGYKGILL
ncbi:MAG: response regulator transcription factor [Firmicutes bacterium]|nr:response regulator transcription factor [Bacillota bacterium]